MVRRCTMREKGKGTLEFIGLCVLVVAVTKWMPAQAAEPPGIPPEIVAEYLHAIIQAERTLYSTHVVERLQDLEITEASEE